MPLFIVIAKHSAETCPAGNPEMGKMLLAHIHQDNASKFGINVQASAGAESQHTLHLIMDAGNSQRWMNLWPLSRRWAPLRSRLA